MNTSKKFIAAFSEEQTQRLTGISKFQLGYWHRTNFYRPTYTEDNKRLAFSRIYSFKDIVALRVLNALRNQYKIPLQHLREVSERLEQLNPDPSRWSETKLYPLKNRVVWYEEGSELPQEIVSGQYVSPVVLHEVAANTEQTVQRLFPLRERSKVGSVEKSRYVVHNAAVIGGTRIPVNAVKRFAEAGYSVEQILREYPDLTEQDISAALEFKNSSAA